MKGIKMKDKKRGNKKKDVFKGRVLIKPFDLVAAVNHLQDNFNPEKPLVVTLTTKIAKSQKVKEEKDAEVIKVRSREQIPEINKILRKKMMTRNVHISIL